MQILLYSNSSQIPIVTMQKIEVAAVLFDIKKNLAKLLES